MGKDSAVRLSSKLLVSACEYVPDRLYFVTLQETRSSAPRSTLHTHYFSVDDELVYENFYSDFGPLNLAMVHRYCNKVLRKLDNFPEKKIVHYTNALDVEKRTNAAFLISAFAVLHLGFDVDEAFRPIVDSSEEPVANFRDASWGPAVYTISVYDCLKALWKACKANFYNPEDFSIKEYEHYEKVQHGDFNWLVPSKFLAFCGPHAQTRVDASGYPLYAPEYYFEYFNLHNITDVIRLNKPLYDGQRFAKADIQHHELFFQDGSVPSQHILDAFLHICEQAKGAVAVHCKAGLGRTGSLIGCYIMKHWRWTALETIAWLRICRPGSVIGHQQEWMESKQEEMWNRGNNERVRWARCSYPVYSLKLRALLITQRSKFLRHDEDRLTGVVDQVESIHINEVDNCEANDVKNGSNVGDNREADIMNGNNIIIEEGGSSLLRNGKSRQQDNLPSSSKDDGSAITQGDRLNMIKAKKQLSHESKGSSSNRSSRRNQSDRSGKPKGSKKNS